MTDSPADGAALRVMDSQGLGWRIGASLLCRKGQMRGAQADDRTFRLLGRGGGRDGECHRDHH